MQDRYCLQMVACGSCGNGSGAGASSNIYSTEETVCGTWIDGKPIYRKVITGITDAKSGTTGHLFANVSDLSIERMIRLYGNMSDNTNNSQIVIPVNFIMEGVPISSAISMWYRPPEGNIYYTFINNGGKYSSCTVYLVLEYTKSTN